MALTNSRQFRTSVLFAVVISMLVAACGSSKSSTKQSAKELTLNVGMPSPTINWAPFWVAAGAGLFTKQNLNVHVVNYAAGNAITAELVSGEIDLAFFGSTTDLIMINSGEKAQVIFDLSDFEANDFALVGKKGINSIGDLVAMGKSCVLTTTPPGSSIYAWLQSVIRAYGLRCQLTAAGQSTGPNMLAAAVSGSSDAATVTATEALSAEHAGQVSILVNPFTLSRTEAAKIAPQPFPTEVVGGLPTDLHNKEEAVVRFVKALIEANKLIGSSGAEVLTNYTLKSPQAWVGTPASIITSNWQLQKPHESNGRITAAQWSVFLGFLPMYGVSFNSSNPAFQYPAAVDMSYYDSATKGG